MALSTDDLCKIMHYAVEREVLRADGSFVAKSWEETDDAYKQVMRGAVSALEMVIVGDAQDRFREDIIACLDDMRRKPAISVDS